MSARERVTGNDAIWLQDSPQNLMVINAVLTLDRIGLEPFRALFRTRVLEGDAGRRFARLRRRVTSEYGAPHWEDDPAFDVTRHIVEAPAPLATKEQLEAYVAATANQPLPGDRPPWQIQHVHQFGADASALIARIHHVVGDGHALVSLLLALMDADAAPDAAAAAPPARRGDRSPGRIRSMVEAPLVGPFLLARRMAERADRSALHGPPLRGAKRVAWSEPIALEDVKVVTRRLGATVNDVLLACVAGGVRRYLAAGSSAAVDAVRVSMPVSVRAPSEPPALNNRFATVLLELPVGMANAVERVRETKRRLDALKRSVEPVVMYGAASVLLRVLPRAMSRGIIDYLANKCTCVVTNVPGPREPLRIAGSTLRTLMFWVPQRARIGLGISILSFSGRVHIGALGDAEVMPDPAQFIRACEAELGELRAAAAG